MNERIRELIKEADRKCSETRRVYDEILAELIVRECVDVLKKDMELAHIQLIPLDFNIYANGRLQRTIKEHFGVEE
jgi:hypothetical protein